MIEKGREKVSERKNTLLPFSVGAVQLLPQLSHSPFPPRLGCQPHTGKVEPLDGTLEKMEAAEVKAGWDRGKKEAPLHKFLTNVPLFHSFEEFLEVPRPKTPNTFFLS